MPIIGTSSGDSARGEGFLYLQVPQAPINVSATVIDTQHV